MYFNLHSIYLCHLNHAVSDVGGAGGFETGILPTGSVGKQFLHVQDI